MRSEQNCAVIKIGAEEHFANATEISIPAALAPVVDALIGLDDFHPQAQHTNTNGSHTVVPDDLAAIYDITPLYNLGIDGSGVSIAVLGQSALEASFSDIRTFRSKYNLRPADPQTVLYGTNPGVNGAVSEADLDLEWAGAVARNSPLIYVYATDAEVARIYAVDQNVAPIVTSSYGSCEAQRAYLSVMMQSIVQQGNAQGMTFFNASGDAGPAACDDQFYEPAAANGPVVQFPSSIPEMTAVGGTEFAEDSPAEWNTTNSAAGASAAGYIPEIGWNDTTAYGAIAASTGGPSMLYPKPAWQTGPGVPGDGVRDTPDVAMAASAVHDGFAICTEGFCGTSGGTSVAAPVFAGIVALPNHSLVSRGVLNQPGLGNINPALYQLANANSNAFNDIATGNNIVPCVANAACSNGTLGYTAGPGFDMVTGLGSVDATNLVNQWNASGAQSTLSAQADQAAVTLSDPVKLSIAVTSASGVAPTGSVYANQSGTGIPFGTQAGDVLLGSATLVPSGNQSTATLSVYPGQLTVGSDSITVTYGGDSNVNGSAASVGVNVSVPLGHSAVTSAVFSSY